jgi:diamine N-acetyltransferase
VIVTLRPTTASDLEFVTTLERDAANRDYIGQWSDDEHLAAIRGERNRRHRIIEVDGVPGGYMISYDGRPASPSIYLKRFVVREKERGVGRAAMRAFLADIHSHAEITFTWLLVREWNARAQAVYGHMGYERYEPSGEEADALAAYAEGPSPQSFRMRLTCTPDLSQA